MRNLSEIQQILLSLLLEDHQVAYLQTLVLCSKGASGLSIENRLIIKKPNSVSTAEDYCAD